MTTNSGSCGCDNRIAESYRDFDSNRHSNTNSKTNSHAHGNPITITIAIANRYGYANGKSTTRRTGLSMESGPIIDAGRRANGKRLKLRMESRIAGHTGTAYHA